MCLKPVKIYCNSHYIYRNSQHKLVNYVACGKCAECQQNRTNELMFRTRYQALDTFKRGGYIIFDTLTYDENYIPWSKALVKREFGVDIPDELNFRTFDYRDFSLFMKRLRKVVSSRYGSSRNIKYFVSSEYGTKEGRTHRGHFHCIFSFLIVKLVLLIYPITFVSVGIVALLTVLMIKDVPILLIIGYSMLLVILKGF